MKETGKEECSLLTCLNRCNSTKRSITRAWFLGGMGRRNKLLGADLKQLLLSRVSRPKTWGARVEGLHGKGEGRRKEKEMDGTAGLCFG